MKAGKLKKAADVASAGALLMLDKGKWAAGSEMGRLYVDTLKEFPEESLELDALIRISQAFPPGLASHDEAAYLRAALDSFDYVPQLQLKMGLLESSKGKFRKASGHFLKANAPARHAEMIAEWSKTAQESYDLLMLRTTLQYLVLENMADASALLKASKLPRDGRTYHFLDFLIQTLERNAAPLFKMLTKAYSSEVESCASLVDRVGFVYYDIPEPVKQGNFMQQMMSSMMG